MRIKKEVECSTLDLTKYMLPYYLMCIFIAEEKV